MPSYAFVIDYADRQIVQFAHPAGSYVRTFGTYNATWTPVNAINFDPITGLPTSDALGATDLQNPCSLCADAISVYVLDVMTCRIFRIQPDTGTVVAAFGGKRGIGAGRITPDTARTAVINLANGVLWVTDNLSGKLVTFTRTGTWLADYNLADWAAATGLTLTQCTGIAWDIGRGHYWANVQNTTNSYLIRVNSAGTALPDGTIDLTARDGIGGTTSTGLLAELNRGLMLRGDFAWIWAGDTAYGINLSGSASTDDAAAYTTGGGRIAPGFVGSDSGAVLVGLSQPNEFQGVNSLVFVNLDTRAVIAGYGPTTVHPPATGGTVAEPWDMIVVPYFELLNPGHARNVSVRANIRNRTPQTVAARANLRGRTAPTITGRARILLGTIRQVTAFAAIDVPAGPADHQFTNWSVDDQAGAFTRTFSATAETGTGLQPGNEWQARAGYDRRRMLIMTGVMDEVDRTDEPDQTLYAIAGRDSGAQEVQTLKITKTYNSFPPNQTITAYYVLRDAAGLAGMTLGAIEFPDYPLFGSYVAHGRTILEIVADLAAPWNLFKRVEYLTQIRDRVLSVKKLDWQNPPVRGQVVPLGHMYKRSRKQKLYLDQPRLVEVDLFYIRGAAYLRPRTSSGVVTRVEYFRNVATAETQNAISGQTLGAGDAVNPVSAAQAQTVVTETESIEQVYGDKVLNRDERVYINDELSAETKERMFYVEPGEHVTTFSAITASADLIVYQSTAPSQNALPWVTQTKRWGWIERKQTVPQTDGDGNALTDGSGNVLTQTQTNTIFTEVFREVTQYYYDSEGRVACEATSTQELDEDTFQWGPTKLTQRIHSQTTGNSVRSSLSNFTFEDSKYKMTSVSVQQVGGVRPDPVLPNSRYGMIATQAQSPLLFGVNGDLVDIAQSRYTWSYQNPLLGQAECDRLYQLTLEERAFQLTGPRWETVPFETYLNPAIHAAQPIILEISPGVFRDYWVQEVSHRMGTDGAFTSGTAMRITLEDL